ncbi:AAC(3) family N-acetyltransferase [Sagittula sp. NFXS13]|uniref:AAC(3) family N-acetyltransferase n=1 Tax=Sagittula sp. NFXS13 TaxID=2819095 RepID=UPI0032DF4B44
MFSGSGIINGSVLLVHSSMARTFNRERCGPKEVIDDLLAQLGPDGTLLLPLFNFDFTKGTPFDFATTPSHMGALSEFGRTWPGAVRTCHPIYGFAAIGAQAERFSGVNNRSGYGADSPFAMLRELDGQIAVIDLPDQNAMTFYHHVEETLAVPYRYHKNFSASYTNQDGETSTQTYSIFVRDIENGVVTSVDRMGERLWDQGLYTGDRPGVGHGMRTISARALFDEVASVIEAGQAGEFLYAIE